MTKTEVINNLVSMGKYSMHVEKDYLKFSAAHFLIFGEKCERLHGHNYAVSVDLEGELDPQIGYIFDFIALKEYAEHHCNALDHKTIVPSKNSNIAIKESDEYIEVTFRNKTFTFPESDVLILPIQNCTAELLAFYLCQRLREDLEDCSHCKLTKIKVGVEESPGQAAYYEEELS